MPLITKLKDLLGLDRAREIYNEWAALLPAKSHLDSEYNFPTARFAGAGILGRKEKDKKDTDQDRYTDTDKYIHMYSAETFLEDNLFSLRPAYANPALTYAELTRLHVKQMRG